MVEKRIGLFGGSFDPIHLGHIAILKSFLYSGYIDEVWVLVNPNPPHKHVLDANYSDRLRMVQMATKDINECLVSRIEEDLPTPNYSYKTIDFVVDHLGYSEVFFCLGSDSIESFKTWKYYEKILDMHFMLQKEFALRCSGNEKTSSYGRLSVICNYLYEVTILKEVSKEFFNPKPKVDSLFVRFSPKKKKVNQKELFNLKKVTRALFNKKRKKISNSLEDILQKESIKKLSVNLDLRPDELSLNEYLQISALVKDDG